MRLDEERNNLLESLEESNCKLAKAFENYREFNKNVKCPKINEDGDISPKDGVSFTEIYWNHRGALENIQECAKNLKKEIVKLETYFREGEKRQQKIAKMFREQKKNFLKKRKETGNNEKRF